MQSTQDKMLYKIKPELISREALREVQKANEIAYIQTVNNANLTPVIINDYIKWFVDNGYYSKNENFLGWLSEEGIKGNWAIKNLIIPEGTTDVQKGELAQRRQDFVKYLEGMKNNEPVIQSSEDVLNYMKTLEAIVS